MENLLEETYEGFVDDIPEESHAPVHFAGDIHTIISITMSAVLRGAFPHRAAMGRRWTTGQSLKSGGIQQGNLISFPQGIFF